MNKNIPKLIRINIFDELKNSSLLYHGRLKELTFLKSLYNLEEYPSNDGRYSSFEKDYIQHNEYNSDWATYWIFDDDRFNLLSCSTDVFTKFIMRIIHPEVRINTLEIDKIIKIYDKHLDNINLKVSVISHESGYPIYGISSIITSVEAALIQDLDNEFVKEQYNKCKDKLASGDYYGALVNARTLVEVVIAEIYLISTGETLGDTGDLVKDYKKIKKLLNLGDNAKFNNELKGLLKNITGIINQIDSLTNKISERHRPKYKPEYHHTKFVIDSAFTISDFLINVMKYQNSRVELHYKKLVSLARDVRQQKLEDISKNYSIITFLSQNDDFIKRRLLDKLLNEFKVNNYNENDIFFAALRILMDTINANYIKIITRLSKSNNQLIDSDKFISEYTLRII